MSAAQQIRALTELVTRLEKKLDAALTSQKSGRRELSQKPSAVRMRRLRTKRRRASHVTLKVTPENTATEGQHRGESPHLPDLSPVTPNVTLAPSPLVPPSPLLQTSSPLPPLIPPPSEKQKPKQSEPLSTTGYFELRGGWEAAFKAATGENYVWDEKDGRAALKLLKAMSIAKALQLGERLISRWRNAPPGHFYRQRGLGMAVLAGAANELRDPASSRACPCGRSWCNNCGMTPEQVVAEEARFRTENAAELAALEERWNK